MVRSKYLAEDIPFGWKDIDRMDGGWFDAFRIELYSIYSPFSHLSLQDFGEECLIESCCELL